MRTTTTVIVLIVFAFEALLRPPAPVIHLCSVSFSFRALSAQKTCHLSYISLNVSVLFRGAHSATRLLIRIYVNTYIFLAFRGACAPTKTRHIYLVRLYVCTYIFGRVIRLLGCRVPTLQRNYFVDEEHPKRAGRPPPVCNSSLPSVRVPVPLSKLTLACPSCGCFHAGHFFCVFSMIN